MFDYGGFALFPGIDSVRESVEGHVTWGPWEYNRSFVLPAVLDGGSRDAGNTPTTLLRPGLLMGRNSTTGKVKEWTPAATDGTEKILGPLLWSAQTQLFGEDKDRWQGYVLCGGLLKAGSVLVPGQSDKGLSGQALEFVVRSELSNRFLFDDAVALEHGRLGQRIVNKTDDYVLTADDNGVTFTNHGDDAKTVFTLPAVNKSKGFKATFLSCAATGLRVASAEAGKIIGLNNAAADFVELSTAGQMIGGGFTLLGINNSLWFAIPHVWSGQTTTLSE